MKIWVEAVLQQSLKKGPQTAAELAVFVAESCGIDNRPSAIVYRLRRAVGVTVEQSGKGRSATYLVVRKVPAATAGAA